MASETQLRKIILPEIVWKHVSKSAEFPHQVSSQAPPLIHSFMWCDACSCLMFNFIRKVKKILESAWEATNMV